MSDTTKPDYEVWADYFRVKTQFMDYMENLDDAISQVLVNITAGVDRKNRDLLLKAQKHIFKAYYHGYDSEVFPRKLDPEDVARIKSIGIGEWKDVKDFIWVREKFSDWLKETKFYSVAKEIDNRPLYLKR